LEPQGVVGKYDVAAVASQGHDCDPIVAVRISHEVDHLTDHLSLIVLDGHAHHLAAAEHHAVARGIPFSLDSSSDISGH
jgi:hypothetical protein